MLTTSNLDLSLYAEALTDKMLIAILENTGAKLIYLNLSSTQLTNNALRKLVEYCPNLERLILNNMPNVTNQ